MTGRRHGRSPRGHTGRAGLRSAPWLPIFDDLAEPAAVARLAAEAEEAGWHGSSYGITCAGGPPLRQAADPWITLAAIATATERPRHPELSRSTGRASVRRLDTQRGR